MHRVVAEQAQEDALFGVLWEGCLDLNLLREHEQIEGFQNIVYICDHACPVLNQFIRAGTSRREDTSRNGKDFASLVEGTTCCDEGAAGFGGFGDQDSL